MAESAPKPMSKAEVRVHHLRAVGETTTHSKDKLKVHQRATVRAVDKKIAEREEGSLSNMATGFEYGKKADSVEDARMFTGVDTKTGKRIARPNTNEQSERNKVQESRQAYEALLKSKNILSVNSTQQKLLRDQVETFIKNHEGFNDALKDAAGNIPQTTIDKILNSREYQDHLAKRLNGEYSATNLSTQLDSDLMNAIARHDTAYAEVGTLRTQEAGLKKEVDALKKSKADFEKKGGYTSTSGTSTADSKEGVYTELDQHPQIQVFKNTQRMYENALRTGDATKIGTAEAALDKLRTSPTSGPMITEYEGLQAERNAITKGMTDKEPKWQETKQKLVEKEGELRSAMIDRNNYELQRQEKANEFYDNVTRAAELAAKDHLTEGLERSIRENPDIEEELGRELQEDVNKKLNERMDRKYRTKKTTGRFGRGKEIYVRDKDKTKADVDAIQRALGKDLASPNGDMSGVDAHVIATLKDSGVTQDQIARIMGDDKLKEMYRTSIVTKTLASHLEAGGKIDKVMKNYLENSSWLRNDSMANLVSKNPESSGITTGEDLQNLAAEKDGKKNTLLAIFLALGLTMSGANAMAEGADSLPHAA